VDSLEAFRVHTCPGWLFKKDVFYSNQGTNQGKRGMRWRKQDSRIIAQGLSALCHTQRINWNRRTGNLEDALHEEGVGRERMAEQDR
jgi:hypothetical protein